MMAAVVGMTAACQKEEFVTFNPENVTVPVLHAVEDIVVTADNKENGSVTFTWDAADFGVKAQIFYSLDMAKGDKVVNLFTGISGTKTSVSLDNINNKAFNDLEIPSDEATEVVFTLSAKLNVGSSYAAAPVTGKVTPTAAEKVYPKLWVVGSYNGWAHDASNLFLFNFAEDDDVYSGVIDFGEDHASNEFKITGGGWGNDEHSATGAQTEEASANMVVGGGDNVTAFKAKRYYHFSFSRSALTLSKNYSFDQVGIIGLNGDWENDIVMEYSPAKQRFYADIEVPAATEMKFRMDADWAVNFGGDKKALSAGGDNIPVEAGNYRVYFNMNNLDAITCTFDARAFGTEEGAAEEEKPEDKLPEGARPVNVIMKSAGWETTNLYGWGAKLSFAWPGVAADGTGKFGGVDYLWWTLPAENWGATDVGLIFNNGTVQTVDIKDFTLDGDKAFELGEAGADGKLTYEVIDAPVITVTYANEAGWDSVNVYGWGADGVTFSLGDWPGQAMTKDGDSWVYEFPAEHIGKNVNLIFNNGNGAQTVDITGVVFNGDKAFDNSNAAIKQ